MNKFSVNSLLASKHFWVLFLFFFIYFFIHMVGVFFSNIFMVIPECFLLLIVTMQVTLCSVL